ncbi:Ubiquitin C-terminal hydrolase 12 [Cardamine amara subsp. amara]|uniref:Ubiquitin C-terminal hydrolase 12 n=1 Tax=Cardamine amara subsp. amara TaxID=228776 RepID=A0ABD1B7D9_CARAN
MITEEKKRNTNYGSVFLFCFFCFVFVAEVVRFAKPYYNLIETDATLAEEAVVEGSYYVKNSVSPCHFMSSSSVSAVPKKKQHEKLSAVATLWRERPPTSYCIKFESFATLLKLVKDGKYESRPFSIGGYNWTFLIYPNGNKMDGANGYVSLYARIDNSTLISDPKDVYAEIKFFVYNRVYDKYYTYQETEARRFHLFKPEWGVPLFQPTSVFSTPTTGYIFDGEQCVFGIDIFVAQTFKEWEVFSFKENIKDPIFTWKLTHFSTLFTNSYTSDSFSSGGSNWVLKVYPNGDGYGKGNSLSLYLLSASNEKAYVRAKLRVLDQIRSNHVEKLVDGWANATENSNGWGYEKFVPLADLKDASKGLVVDDALKVEVEIIGFSKTDSTLSVF